MYIADKLELIDQPKIYTRNNIECYLDPIRKKLIQITPEENVRQLIIRFIIEYINVDKSFIQVEMPLKEYGVNSSKRADIIIEHLVDEQLNPLIVVECKARNIELTDRVLEQAAGYADELNSPFIIITNGIELFFLEYDEKDNTYYYLESLITYSEILGNNVKRNSLNNKFIRTELNKINDISFIEKQDFEKRRYMIGKDSINNLKSFTVNLGECLLDTSKKIPKGIFNGVKIVDDIGIRYMDYGNSGGGNFPGSYRTIIVEDKDGILQMFSFMVSSYEKTKGRKGVSVIIVAIDNFEVSHNTLQLRIEGNVKSIDNKIKITHNGKITVGNKGSAKIEGLKKILDIEYPELLVDEEIDLGYLVKDKLYYMDDDEVMKLITNLVKYSFAREMYRREIKAGK